jgi:two-component system cell cycle sensor histidine kinase/response regulator CckA
MKDGNKTKKQLINELAKLRQQTTKMEARETRSTLSEKKLNVAIDIGELKKRKSVQRKNENYFRTLLSSMHDEILVIDRDYKITDVNKDYLNIFGRRREELIGKHCYHILHGADEPCDRQGKECKLYKVFAMGEPENYRHKRITADGSMIWVDILLSPLKDEKGNITHVIKAERDVSKEVQLENQFLQKQKMESIGTLAGGIAHDFNNILSTIIMNTEFGLNKLLPVTESLEVLLKAAHRAKDLVEQILTFSCKTEQTLQPLSISPIIKESLKLLRASLPATIEICQHIKPKSDMVLMTPTQIHQILINLCTNAAFAMREGGGILTVSLVDGFFDSDTEQVNPDIKPGPYLRLTVRDTGHGMVPEVLARIFDPFFTTKKMGEGAGLGLSVVHGIVKNIGGAINVKSEPGRGTVFDLFLPKGAHEGGSDVGSFSLPSDETGRILIIDDEEYLVNVVKNVLSDFGYQVVSKTNSVQALDLFRQKPEQFDLVITDCTMPRMTGVELAKKMLSIRSDIPVILCTGFNESISRRDAEAMGIRDLLMKPISILELTGVVDKILCKR